MKKTRQTTKITEQQNPITEPGKYLRYGSNSYRVLSYAKFRNKKTFTTTDYREFTLKKISSERIRESVNYLHKIGYIEKIDNPYPTHFNMKNMFKITLSGQHALIHLARKEKEREHNKKIRDASASGNLRWYHEKRRLKNTNQPPIK